MARIAVGGFEHETNSFVSARTDFAWFASHRDRPGLCRGVEIFEWFMNASFALHGFVKEMGREQEFVPLVHVAGNAGGLITDDAFERIAGEMIGRLSEAMPVDAVYLDLHGAAVSLSFEDCEGEILRRVRAVVGEKIPVAISLDYHANVTPLMVEATDSIVVYRTYPHVDREDTGAVAARVMKVLLERGRPAGRALRKPAFLLPIIDQCTLLEPSASVVARTVTASGDLVNLSYAAGFPPSDLYWCGPAIIAHAWTQESADRAADAMAAEVEAMEADFRVSTVSAEEGVRRAIEISRRAAKPVILADVQDNPGGGSSADSTGLLRALVNAGAEGAVIGYLCDPLAAKAAYAAGEGAEIRLALGGRSDVPGVTPFEATFTVDKLGDGRMVSTGIVSGGRLLNLGPMALLRVGGVSVAVTSQRMQAFDQAPFLHLDVDPGKQKILALKSSVHFRAEFEPLAEKVIVVVAPGGHLVDCSKFPFKRLRSNVRLGPLGPLAKAEPRNG